MQSDALIPVSDTLRTLQADFADDSHADAQLAADFGRYWWWGEPCWIYGGNVCFGRSVAIVLRNEGRPIRYTLAHCLIAHTLTC